jgi:catechol 2,3-dioxygenase-like lactoylglutathione lyase family enzyme
MFARVTVTASDPVASRRFYESVLASLPGEQWDVFAVEAGEPTRHLHIAFAAVSPADVDRFWQAGVEAGYTSDGSPIDHLWLGVADLDASRASWEAIAPELGLDVDGGRWPGHVFVGRDRRHLALVDDGRPPAENVGIAITGLDGDPIEVL